MNNKDLTDIASDTARQHAKRKGSKEYLPKKNEDFVPHAWVIDAMRKAVVLAKKDSKPNNPIFAFLLTICVINTVDDIGSYLLLSLDKGYLVTHQDLEFSRCPTPQKHSGNSPGIPPWP